MKKVTTVLVATLITGIVSMLWGFRLGVLVRDKSNLLPEEKQALFFAAHFAYDPPSDYVDTIDAYDISTGYNFEDIDILWMHTEGVPVEYSDPNITNSILAAIESGKGLVLSGGWSYFLAEYMGLGDADSVNWGPCVWDAAYFVRAIDSSSLFNGLSEWDLSDGLPHRQESPLQNIWVINPHANHGKIISFSPSVPCDTLRIIQLHTTYGWNNQSSDTLCAYFPGICDPERSVYVQTVAYSFNIGNGNILMIYGKPGYWSNENGGFKFFSSAYCGPVLFTMLKNALNGEFFTQVEDKSSIKDAVNFEASLIRKNTLELELASPSVKRVEIKIYDVSGKALITTTRTIRQGFNAIKLDISNLLSGEYFVCIRTASNKYVKRFIVMR